MIRAFLESPSNLDVHPRIRFSMFEIISPEFASKSTLYDLCHAHEGVRCVTFDGPTIYPTAMICTFLESQTNLDVHPGKRFALFGQNRRN